MASPVQHPSLSKNVAIPFPRASAPETGLPLAQAKGAPRLSALSVEFVAEPQETHRVQSAIPASLAGALGDVAGFAGCLVLVSEQEVRLVTVVTLWIGDGSVKRCSQNVRWIHKLLAPCVDRCLRVQTLAAHLPVLPMLQPHSSAADKSSAMQCLTSAEETVCVA
jgi:hypothetical protein